MLWSGPPSALKRIIYGKRSFHDSAGVEPKPNTDTDPGPDSRPNPGTDPDPNLEPNSNPNPDPNTDTAAAFSFVFSSIIKKAMQHDAKQWMDGK